MLRPTDAHTCTRSIDEWMRVRKRRRQTGVIDRSSLVAVILVPALLAAAATPAVVRGRRQIESNRPSPGGSIRFGLGMNSPVTKAALEGVLRGPPNAAATAATAVQGNQ